MKTRQLHPGDKAPDFTGNDQFGNKISLSDFKKSKLILYFYPKDSTPGCTTEGNDFTELHDDFKAANTQIFGVSMDSMRKHENFKAKQGFSFELIADTEAELCNAFGVYQLKKNFGKEYMGIVRSTFIISPDGTLTKEWNKVKVSGHAQEVLQAIKQLQS